MRSMIRIIIIGAVAAFGLSRPLLALQNPDGTAAVGTAVPAFIGWDIDGKKWTNESVKGRYVVLEWMNPECPFSKKHYDSHNMQQLQRRYTGQGVVWLTVDSSAPGKQGYLTPPLARTFIKECSWAGTALLLDSTGRVGRTFDATTTPHIFILDPKGQLIYQGAIDDRPSTEPADVQGATNYVAQTLDAAMAGKPVSVANTRPYGCSVKYAK